MAHFAQRLISKRDLGLRKRLYFNIFRMLDNYIHFKNLNKVMIALKTFTNTKK